MVLIEIASNLSIVIGRAMVKGLKLARPIVPL